MIFDDISWMLVVFVRFKTVQNTAWSSQRVAVSWAMASRKPQHEMIYLPKGCDVSNASRNIKCRGSIFMKDEHWPIHINNSLVYWWRGSLFCLLFFGTADFHWVSGQRQEGSLLVDYSLRSDFCCVTVRDFCRMSHNLFKKQKGDKHFQNKWEKEWKKKMFHHWKIWKMLLWFSYSIYSSIFDLRALRCSISND